MAAAAAVLSPSALRRGMGAPGAHQGQQHQHQQQQQYQYQQPPPQHHLHHQAPAMQFPQEPRQHPQHPQQHHHHHQPQAHHHLQQQQPQPQPQQVVYQQAFHQGAQAALHPDTPQAYPAGFLQVPHPGHGPVDVPEGVPAASSQPRKRNRRSLTAAATFSGSLAAATVAADAVSAAGPTAGHAIRKSSTMPNWPSQSREIPDSSPYYPPPHHTGGVHRGQTQYPQASRQGSAASVFEPINQEAPGPCQVYCAPEAGAPIGRPPPQPQHQQQQQHQHQHHYQQQPSYQQQYQPQTKPQPQPQPQSQHLQQQRQAEQGSSYDPAAFASEMRGLQGTPLERLLNATPDIVVDLPPHNPPHKTPHAHTLTYTHPTLPTVQAPVHQGYTGVAPGSSPPSLQSLSGASNPLTGPVYQREPYHQQAHQYQGTQAQHQQPQYQRPQQYQQQPQPQQYQPQECLQQQYQQPQPQQYQGQAHQGWGGAPVAHQGLPTGPEAEGTLAWAGTEPLQAQESRTGGSRKGSKKASTPVAPPAAVVNPNPTGLPSAHQGVLQGGGGTLPRSCMGPPAPPAPGQPRPSLLRLSPDSSCTYQGTPPASQAPHEAGAPVVYQGQGQGQWYAAGAVAHPKPAPAPRPSAFQPVRSSTTWQPASKPAPVAVPGRSSNCHVAAGGNPSSPQGTEGLLAFGSPPGVPRPQSQIPPVLVSSAGTPQAHLWAVTGTPEPAVYNNNNSNSNPYMNNSNNNICKSNSTLGVADSGKGGAREFNFFPCPGPGAPPAYQGYTTRPLPKLQPGGPEAAAQAASATPGMRMGVGMAPFPHTHHTQPSQAPFGGVPAAYPTPTHTHTHTNTSTVNTAADTSTHRMSPPGAPSVGGSGRARRMTFGEGVGASWMPEAGPSPERRPRCARGVPGAGTLPCRGGGAHRGGTGLVQGAQGGEEEMGEGVDLGLGLSLMGRSMSVSSTSSTTNPSK